MPRPLENPAEGTVYVSSLRNKRPANSYVEPDNPTDSVTKPDNPVQPSKKVDTGMTGMVRCMTYAATLAIGAAIGAVFIAKTEPAPVTEPAARATAQPRPSVENTKPTPPKRSPTKAVGLSPECQAALDNYEHYLQSASNIASTSDVQLDILNDAYVAIIAKNWRQLNNLAERQRKLQSSLAADSNVALPAYAELTESLEKCRSQGR